MKKKLTLTIEESVIAQAKRQAREEGKSVSQMVEEFLSHKAKNGSDWAPKPGSSLSKLYGAVSLPERYKELSDTELITNILSEKYFE